MPTEMKTAISQTGPASMADLDAGTGEHLTTQQIAGIQRPVTCLLGDLTPPTLAKATDRILALIPHARLVRIAGAGHAIHFDRPEEFVAAVTAAVDGRALGGDGSTSQASNDDADEGSGLLATWRNRL